MSSSLVWTIIKKGKSLPTSLKWKLEKRYSFPRVFTINDIEYLQGLRDSDIEGADELIEIIMKYQEIELKLEY